MGFRGRTRDSANHSRLRDIPGGYVYLPRRLLEAAGCFAVLVMDLDIVPMRINPQP